jgi:hypothetical protein
MTWDADEDYDLNYCQWCGYIPYWDDEFEIWVCGCS